MLLQPEEEASIFMSPDEHFESLNTVLILSINVHWLYGNGEEGTKETQRANGAKTTKKWKKIAKTNLPLSGEIKIKMASSSSPV